MDLKVVFVSVIMLGRQNTSIGEIAQLSSKLNYLEGFIFCSSWKGLVAIVVMLRVFIYYDYYYYYYYYFIQTRLKLSVLFL